MQACTGQLNAHDNEHHVDFIQTSYRTSMQQYNCNSTTCMQQDRQGYLAQGLLAQEAGHPAPAISNIMLPIPKVGCVSPWAAQLQHAWRVPPQLAPARQQPLHKHEWLPVIL